MCRKHLEPVDYGPVICLMYNFKKEKETAEPCQLDWVKVVEYKSKNCLFQKKHQIRVEF